MQHEPFRKYFFHATAWLLSVAVHFFFAGMLGPGRERVLAGREMPKTITVHLAPLDGTEIPQTIASAQEAQLDSSVETAVSESAVFNDTVAANDRPITDSPPRQALPLDNESTALPVLPLPEQRYFPVGELTEKPSLMQDISPDMEIVLPDVVLPPAIVQLFISEHGEVDKVAMEDDDLPEDAQRFVINSFSKIKFRPGMMGELPVKSQLSIEVTFENTTRLVTPVSVSIVH